MARRRRSSSERNFNGGFFHAFFQVGKKKMKALVQRVVSGSVAVDGETVSRIGRGIVALIGIHR
jgi:hypothetical protein